MVRKFAHTCTYNFDLTETSSSEVFLLHVYYRDDGSHSRSKNVQSFKKVNANFVDISSIRYILECTSIKVDVFAAKKDLLEPNKLIKKPCFMTMTP